MGKGLHAGFFCLKTWVICWKPGLSVENLGFLLKTWVFILWQKSKVCARKPCLTAENPSFSEKPGFSPEKPGFSPEKPGFLCKPGFSVEKPGFSVEKPGFSGASLKIKVPFKKAPFNFLHILWLAKEKRYFQGMGFNIYNVQYTLDIVTALGHYFLTTLFAWLLHPTWI